MNYPNLFKYTSIILIGIFCATAQPSHAQMNTNTKAKLYFMEASRQFNQNNFKESLAYIKKTEQTLGTTNGRILNLKIKALYNDGQFLEAEEALTLFVNKYSDSVTADLREETLSYFVKIEKYAEAERRERRKVHDGLDTFTDSRDGNEYRIVQIDNQIWMAENLRYAGKYKAINRGANGYVYYGNFMTDLCPSGWRVPSISDWEILFENVKNDFGGSKKVRRSLIGGKVLMGHEWKGVAERIVSEYFYEKGNIGYNNYDLDIRRTESGYSKDNGQPKFSKSGSADFWTSSVSWRYYADTHRRYKVGFIVDIRAYSNPSSNYLSFSPRSFTNSSEYWYPVRCVRNGTLSQLKTQPASPSPNASGKTRTSSAVDRDGSVFTIVEHMPEMIGGQATLYRNITYPESALRSGVEGVVMIQFVVNTEGNVEDTKVIRGIGSGCDEEALRVLRTMKFTPGRQQGKPVPVRLIQPIRFKLTKQG